MAASHKVAVSLPAMLGASLVSGIAAAEPAPAVRPGPNGVIFALGEMNNGYWELRNSGLEGVHEYECTVGVDCVTAEFPSGLYHMDFLPRVPDKDGVATARIRFNLEEDVDLPILRIARGGSETLLVQVDEAPPVELPASAFHPPSRDGWGVGVYDLNIGPLDSGEHVIALSMEPVPGDGSLGFDAIILRVGTAEE